ncbi:hypothetical protein C0584_00950 [Candidatus Parcubacteria bacterium]|nr:MAG: hypothetical protein C0584_00950 [Candidatus Parcubacteria bacterium]
MEKNNMKWINFLHLYQPANTESFNISEANEKSYKRIFRALEENENIVFTFNVAGCLIMRWEEMAEFELIKRLVSLVKKGRVEITGTAMYHPILPLIPEEEVIRQIDENEEILKKHFGSDFKPKGFFLPEMAYSPEVAKIIYSKGYKWIIVDEIIHNGKLNQLDVTKVYEDKNSGLILVPRARTESNTYVPQKIAKLLKEGKTETIITASDAELYGLRHIDHTAEFEKLLRAGGFETQSISDFISEQKDIKKIDTVAGNWNASEEEIADGQPFYVWYNRKNKIQMKLWEMQRLVYKTVYEYQDDENFKWARWHLVRGLISCNYWWASEKDFQLFSGVTWNPDEIERGISDLTRAVRSISNEKTKNIKIKVEKMAGDVRFRVWQRHWKTHWK